MVRADEPIFIDVVSGEGAWLQPRASGARDFMAHVDGQFMVHHGERIPEGRKPERTDAGGVDLHRGPARIGAVPERHAVFCQLPQPANPRARPGRLGFARRGVPPGWVFRKWEELKLDNSKRSRRWEQGDL